MTLDINSSQNKGIGRSTNRRKPKLTWTLHCRICQVILPLQLRKSQNLFDKRNKICHHCRLHLALGVVRSPFASRIMTPICFTSHIKTFDNINIPTKFSKVTKVYLLLLCPAFAKSRSDCQQIGQQTGSLYTYSLNIIQPNKILQQSNFAFTIQK